MSFQSETLKTKRKMLNDKVIMKITFPLIQNKIQVYANSHQMILQNKRLGTSIPDHKHYLSHEQKKKFQYKASTV